jgi:hypothetical protein
MIRLNQHHRIPAGSVSPDEALGEHGKGTLPHLVFHEFHLHIRRLGFRMRAQKPKPTSASKPKPQI